MTKYKFDLRKDDNSTALMDAYMELKNRIVTMIEEVPASISKSDFVGYYAISGTKSSYESYLIFEQWGRFKACTVSMSDGECEILSGELVSIDAFINDVCETSIVDLTEDDSVSKNYGLLVFRRGEEIVGCITENLFVEK